MVLNDDERNRWLNRINREVYEQSPGYRLSKSVQLFKQALMATTEVAWCSERLIKIVKWLGERL